MKHQKTIIKSRKAVLEDIDSIYEIYMDEAVNPFLNVEFMSKSDFKQIFNQLLNQENLWICELDGNVVGLYAITRRKRRVNHVACIDSIALKSDYIGRGLGTQLMQQIIDELQQEGIQRIELIVESDNKSAIKFYQKFGFEIEGTLRKYFKRAYQNHYVDDYIMALVFD